MATHEVVTHLDRDFVPRPKTRAYTIGVDHRPRHYWRTEYEIKDTLEDIGEYFRKRNAKANRKFSYRITKGILFWTLYYPNVKRKMTGYIKPSSGVEIKKSKNRKDGGTNV